MAKRAFRPRKSRLDPFAEFIGEESDAVVARRAEVTPETVRTYRVRRGIPARWRGEAPAQSPALEPVRDSLVSSVGRKRTFRGRRSRLDPYEDLLGIVADQKIALKAGVTVENVRSYRRRRHIPAGWRDGRSAEEGGRVDTASVRWAYRVTVRSGREDKEYVVMAGSLSDAASQAERRLAVRVPRARLVEVAALAEAL